MTIRHKSSETLAPPVSIDGGSGAGLGSIAGEEGGTAANSHSNAIPASNSVYIAGDDAVAAAKSHFVAVPASNSLSLAGTAAVTGEFGDSQIDAVTMARSDDPDSHALAGSLFFLQESIPLKSRLKAANSGNGMKEYSLLAEKAIQFLTSASSNELKSLMLSLKSVNISDIKAVCDCLSDDEYLMHRRSCKIVELGGEKITFWYCGICGERFEVFEDLKKHVYKKYAKVSPIHHKFLPSEISVDWVSRSKNSGWAPLSNPDSTIDRSYILERIGSLFDELVDRESISGGHLNSIVLDSIEVIKKMPDVMVVDVTQSNVCIRHLDYKNLLIIFQRLNVISNSYDACHYSRSNSLGPKSSNTPVEVLIKKESVEVGIPDSSPEKLIHWLYYECFERDCAQDFKWMLRGSADLIVELRRTVANFSELLKQKSAHSLKLSDPKTLTESQIEELNSKIMVRDAELLCYKRAQNLLEKELEALSLFDYKHPLLQLAKLYIQTRLEKQMIEAERLDKAAAEKNERMFRRKTVAPGDDEVNAEKNERMFRRKTVAPRGDAVIAEKNERMITRKTVAPRDDEVIAEKNERKITRKTVAPRDDEVTAEKNERMIPRTTLAPIVDQVDAEKNERMITRKTVAPRDDEVIAEKNERMIPRTNLAPRVDQVDAEKYERMIPRTTLAPRVDKVDAEKNERMITRKTVAPRDDEVIAEKNERMITRKTVAPRDDEVIAEKNERMIPRTNLAPRVDQVDAEKNERMITRMTLAHVVPQEPERRVNPAREAKCKPPVVDHVEPKAKRRPKTLLSAKKSSAEQGRNVDAPLRWGEKKVRGTGQPQQPPHPP